jgi:hypothetical protein
MKRILRPWAMLLAFAGTGVVLSSQATLGSARQATNEGGPILTASQAGALSVQRVPSSAEVTGETARLTTHAGLERTWLGWNGADEVSTGWASDDPVWLVGVEAHGLTVGTVAAVAGMEASEEIGNQPVAGMFFAWDARSGELRTQGSIDRAFAPREWPVLRGFPQAETVLIDDLEPVQSLREVRP